MRSFSAALSTTLAAAFLTGCSSGSASSPSASLPGSGLTPPSVNSAHGRIPLSTIPEQLIKRAKFRLVKVPAAFTRGIAVDIFNFKTANIPIYPKNNSGNEAAYCTVSSGKKGVNDIGSDTKGNLIVPNGFAGVRVYAPPFTASSCGTLLGKISEPLGQAASAAARDAKTGTIVVGNIGGGTGNGVVTCTLESHSCTALNSPNMGTLGGVAMDKAGNCYADAFDVSGAVGLWVYTGCTGTGTELTSANGFTQPYYGGVDVDNRGNLVVVSLLNSTGASPSTVTVYSGCNTGACTIVGGPFNLQGQSVFGHLGRQNERWATFDVTNSVVEVYNYTGHGTGLTFNYSFNNGLTSCVTNMCETATFMPGSKGI